MQTPSLLKFVFYTESGTILLPEREGRGGEEIVI